MAQLKGILLDEVQFADGKETTGTFLAELKRFLSLNKDTYHLFKNEQSILKSELIISAKTFDH